MVLFTVVTTVMMQGDALSTSGGGTKKNSAGTDAKVQSSRVWLNKELGGESCPTSTLFSLDNGLFFPRRTHSPKNKAIPSMKKDGGKQEQGHQCQRHECDGIAMVLEPEASQGMEHKAKRYS